MKKLMIAAMMLLGTSAVFAGDSEPLKAILKASTYAEAENLVKSNLSQLTDNAEKAKAYNHLYELALATANKEEGVQLENQTAEQMGKKGTKQVDEKALYEAIGQAFSAAQECYKYDNMPNAKGKVKPKFGSVADALYNQRGNLINGGVYYQGIKDDANAYKYLSEYVESADYPMFAKFDKSKDANLNNIAYYAGIYAYQNKDWAKAEKYVKYAMLDKDHEKEAKNLLFAVMGAQLKNHADSIGYVQKLKDMYANEKTNDDLLNMLVLTEEQLNMTAEAKQLISDRLAADPDNFTALTLSGDMAMRANNWDEAITDLDKALVKAPEDRKVSINAAIGTCYIQKIQERINKIKGAIAPAAKQQFVDAYKKAIGYLETAKSLDKTYQYKSSWAYALYNAYYFVYGENDPKTVEAAQDAGVK